jgi:hypothetical protein
VQLGKNILIQLLACQQWIGYSVFVFGGAVNIRMSA